MSRKICVYTCITGDYDNLHEIIHPEKSVDYYCFTNNPKLTSKTWKIIPVQNNGLSNHHLSRKIKMLGHPVISDNYDLSVWMDASIVWQKPVTEFVKQYFTKDSLFAAFRHSARTSVYDEAIACLLYNKDSKENIQKTLEFYAQNHFPDNLGLYEMTVFIKRHNDPKVIAAMQTWLDMIQRYSRRDQLSFTYAIWKTGLPVTPINLNVWDNPWFYANRHLSASHNIDCDIYYGNPHQDFDFAKFHHYSLRQRKPDLYHLSIAIPDNTTELEFILTGSIGVNCQIVNISPTPSQTQILGAISYKQSTVFCSNYNAYHFHGNFKKGSKFTITLKCTPLDLLAFTELAEQSWAQIATLINQNSQLLGDNLNLKNQNAQLSDQLQAIHDSKAWKLIQLTRKIIHPHTK